MTPGPTNLEQSVPRPNPPPVVFWFKIYCAVLCLMYLIVAVIAVIFFFVKPEDLEVSAFFTNVMATLYLALGLGLFAVCGLPLILRPRPWVWIYDLIIIALGITSPCLLPACIPLIIFWSKPETRSYFGKD